MPGDNTTPVIRYRKAASVTDRIRTARNTTSAWRWNYSPMDCGTTPSSQLVRERHTPANTGRGLVATRGQTRQSPGGAEGAAIAASWTGVHTPPAKTKNQNLCHREEGQNLCHREGAKTCAIGRGTPASTLVPPTPTPGWISLNHSLGQFSI